jgi:hypothetical protein
MKRFTLVTLIAILGASLSDSIAYPPQGPGYGNNPPGMAYGNQPLTKQQRREMKAQRLEQRAARAERKGNPEKAARLRAKAQAKRDKNARGY